MWNSLKTFWSWIVETSWFTAIIHSGEFWGAVLAVTVASVGGVLGFCKYFEQRRNEKRREVLEWLSNLSQRFHESASFNEIREELAFNKRLYMDIIVAEISHTQMSSDQLKKLRSFTDYIKFFSQILFFAQKLAAEGEGTSAKVLMDHFRWFIEYTLIHWPKLENLEIPEIGSEHLGQRLFGGIAKFGQTKTFTEFFISYLIVNRFYRLSEVAVFLSLQKQCKERDLDFDPPRESLIHSPEDFYEKLKIISKELHNEPLPDTITALNRKWLKVLP